MKLFIIHDEDIESILELQQYLHSYLGTKTALPESSPAYQNTFYIK